MQTDQEPQFQPKIAVMVACPTCGKQRDFSHITHTVEDWQSLIPILEKCQCEACRMKGLLDGIVCLKTR